MCQMWGCPVPCSSGHLSIGMVHGAAPGASIQPHLPDPVKDHAQLNLGLGKRQFQVTV